MKVYPAGEKVFQPIALEIETNEELMLLKDLFRHGEIVSNTVYCTDKYKRMLDVLMRNISDKLGRFAT